MRRKSTQKKPGPKPAVSEAMKTAEEFRRVAEMFCEGGMEKSEPVDVAARMVLPVEALEVIGGRH